MWIADGWKDYEVIDCSKGEKLERWGRYLLVRPDPQVIWDTPRRHKGWKHMNGPLSPAAQRAAASGNFFDLPGAVDHRLQGADLQLKALQLQAHRPVPRAGGQLGLVRREDPDRWAAVKVLNLFAYTGGATLAAAQAGASVTHVDASKGMVTWRRRTPAPPGWSPPPSAGLWTTA